MDSMDLTNNFTVGDMVVYPAQGIGYIEKIEKRNEKDYLKIHIDSSAMDVLLPLEKVKNFGLRHLASKIDTEKALEGLSKRLKLVDKDWKVRLQENQELLKHGDLLSVATVVNSLYRRSKSRDLPTLERRLYESALTMLVDETSSVLGISNEEMRKTIFKKLEA